MNVDRVDLGGLHSGHAPDPDHAPHPDNAPDLDLAPGVPTTREVLKELFLLLEDYAPTWYTEAHHNRAVAALLGRPE